MTFFQKKQKKSFFFSPLVSDHVVTLITFTVRAHFFNFPIEISQGLPPSLYADEVLCAASRAALPPPYSIRVAQKSKKTKPNASARNAFFMQQVRTTPPYSIRVAQHYRYFAKKNEKKTCQRKLRKLSSRSNQSSTFASFGSSKMSLQKLSERQHDFKSFPKTRQDFTK